MESQQRRRRRIPAVLQRRGGRPRPPGTGLAIGVEIGGTKVAAGVVDGEGRVLAQEVCQTPGDDPREVEQVIAGLVRALADTFPVGSVGVGAAGWMGFGGGTVLFSPHLAWRHEPLRANLQALLGRRVLVTNDAD